MDSLELTLLQTDPAHNMQGQLVEAGLLREMLQKAVDAYCKHVVGLRKHNIENRKAWDFFMDTPISLMTNYDKIGPDLQ